MRDQRRSEQCRSADFARHMRSSQPEATVTVAVVEDEPEVREGLAALINGAPGFECIAACANAEEALVGLPTWQPDVVLMDIKLPGMSGIDCIRELKRLLPQAQILMLTVVEDHDRIFRSLAAGASGYLLKKTSPAKLLEAIREVHEGGSPMSSQIARRVVEEFQKPVAAEDPTQKLGKREMEVLQFLAQGLLYKEIAERLGMGMGTVRAHIHHIYEKLHVRSRTEALLKIFPRRGGGGDPAANL